VQADFGFGKDCLCLSQAAHYSKSHFSSSTTPCYRQIPSKNKCWLERYETLWKRQHSHFLSVESPPYVSILEEATMHSRLFDSFAFSSDTPRPGSFPSVESMVRELPFSASSTRAAFLMVLT